MTDWKIIVGDCVEVMSAAPEASIDAIVTDPPYGLEFMGKAWDSLGGGRTSSPGIGDRDTEWVNSRGWNDRRCANCGHLPHGGSPCKCDSPKIVHDLSRWRMMQDWHEAWAHEALRVLKPGGHLLAFGGTRTYHRLVVAVEDAGFEIRDTIAWLYGSGFPKSKNLDGEWQGWGTALKPAFEPIIVARKPLAGTVAANVLAHGTGALNIDACRIGTGDGGGRDGEESAERRYAERGSTNFAPTPGPRGGAAEGRWPANVVLDETAAAMLDEQTGERAAGRFPGAQVSRPMENLGPVGFNGDAGGTVQDARTLDAGGASRFFYVAKASRRERNAGLEGFAERPLNWSSGEQNPGSFQSEGTHRAARNHHPTVKPVELMRWLVRMVTPPGGRVLDPFAGSGTTGIACVLEGFRFIGIEREQEYADIANARIAHHSPEKGVAA